MKLHLEKILKELKPYWERKAVIDPEHAALLVIDIQNVIQFCRQENIPIIFTRHGHTDPPSDSGALGAWWGQVILHGTKDWLFLPEVTVESKDIILPKKRYSAFYETDLEKILRSKGIQDLIISGVMTNLCCETTARDAFMRDYKVLFLIDGTATGRDDHHLATLKNLGFGFASPMTAERSHPSSKIKMRV